MQEFRGESVFYTDDSQRRSRDLDNRCRKNLVRVIGLFVAFCKVESDNHDEKDYYYAYRSVNHCSKGSSPKCFYKIKGNIADQFMSRTCEVKAVNVESAFFDAGCFGIEFMIEIEHI